MEPACVIFNPAARGDRARKFQAELAARSSECTLCPTPRAGAAQSLASEAVAKGCRLIVAAGGDGTLNEVVNGVAEHPLLLPQVRVGLLPLGTVNVFAKELGIPSQSASAWKVIHEGKTRQLDLGLAQWGSGHRYFIQLAGAGLDSRAIAAVDAELKRRLGALAYVAAGLRAFASEQIPLQVTWNGGEERGELVLIGNGRYYGGRFRLFPDAQMNDGLLDVCVFRRVNWSLLVRAGWGLFNHSIARQRGVRYFQTADLQISTAGDLFFELEGENVAPLPARFSIVPQKINFLVPRG